MALSRFFGDSLFRPSGIFSNEFHNLFNDLEKIAASAPYGASSSFSESFAPRVKLTEAEDKYHVEAEVAGFPKESLSIEFQDPQVLRISGKFEQEKKHEPHQQISSDVKDLKTGSDADQGGQPANNSGTVATTTQDDNSKQVSAVHAKVWHNERISRSFSRSIALPSQVDTDAVQASLKDGILSITLQKRERQAGHKKIEIVDAKL